MSHGELEAHNLWLRQLASSRHVTGKLNKNASQLEKLLLVEDRIR